ncbi:MAG: 6-phosphogluconolactonase [Thermodesulfobacteriota bacterium]|nr:6-phosphogluconolactonase [Thermodesulfobacteriota bacterium]
MPSDFETIVLDHPDWASRAADMFRKRARDCVANQGRFAVALSGGSTPRPVHRLLGQEPYRSDIPWTGIHLFWVDDRCVPETSPDSNFGAAKEDFFGHIPMPISQIHPMPVETLPEDGARQYEQELKAFFVSDKSGFPAFDLIFLGIGQDGHTASLFPGHGALDERKMWVVAVKGGHPNVSRLTMTLPVLNSAREIVFLVSGKGKAAVTKAIFNENSTLLPAQRIQPTKGRVIWLVDKQASSLLSKRLRL